MMRILKLKSNAFQGNALSREQLKKVLGGDLGSGGSLFGTCSVTVTCSNGSATCSSDKGKCSKGNSWVQCDDDPTIWC